MNDPYIVLSRYVLFEIYERGACYLKYNHSLFFSNEILLCYFENSFALACHMCNELLCLN